MAKQFEHSKEHNGATATTEMADDSDFNLKAVITRMNQYSDKTQHTLCSSSDDSFDHDVQNGAMAGKPLVSQPKSKDLALYD